MHSEIHSLHAEQETLLKQLAQSRAQVLSLAQEGKLEMTRFQELTATEAALAAKLHLWPLDPGEHLLAAHAYARPYLERLVQHDPTHLVLVDTEHSYTPRKILRRVLDHALDHLNQIDQWLAWQRQGIIPIPTDGWATSAETLPEDLQSLSTAELQAWLWRIDLVISLVAQRTQQLSMGELDWTPPDGGWSLRQVLHHLALAEVFYAVWMDEALPEEPLARYSEANSRFTQRLCQVSTALAEEQGVLFGPSSTTVTMQQLSELILTEERILTGEHALHP
ncbi:hypothetical protein KSD_56800 [Ktedonobacter sp. SOSP1-85]|uniref:DinB family protein n=1 Tax=Ktedonobacter sp. SOSP1-85 TaxID=2778367 RepID=UPI0019167452|nr:DinB family protein [Ktedonobacter sp. SOSP1-85]GHO77909.1 hypothetical protein KSD_56800 [Ktedonobacter sp. SOSP1-85]